MHYEPAFIIFVNKTYCNMAHINGTGPEGKGPKSGRGLGRCKKNLTDEEIGHLGKGLGNRYKSGGGPGKGKRLKASDNFKITTRT